MCFLFIQIWCCIITITRKLILICNQVINIICNVLIIMKEIEIMIDDLLLSTSDFISAKSIAPRAEWIEQKAKSI